jgi:hypothetical protein
MAVTDFLANGAAIPAGSALTATTSTSSTPDFYVNYAKQILANQQALSARPYQPAPMPRVAEFTPAQQAGFAQTTAAANAYQPLTTAATNTLNTAAGMSGMTSAQPYLTAAGGDVTDVSAYMNPYTDAVVSRIAALGERNLRDNLLPALTSKYITSGQLGYGDPRTGYAAPSGMMTDTARAVRDTSADIIGAQSTALQQGYTSAQTAALADLTRKAQLASTAGQLGGQDATRMADVAQQQADLAGMIQKYGLTAGAATAGVGLEQQQQAQKNLDAARADYLAQRGYDQEQIDAMLKTLAATSLAIPTVKEEYGIKPLSTQPAGTAETIAGGLSGVAAVIDAINKKP